MFSEYASKFLAQSQSRFSSFADQSSDPNQQNYQQQQQQQQQQNSNLRHNSNVNTNTGNGNERFQSRRPNLLTAPSQKSFLWWAGYPGNPYQQNGGGSRFGNLGPRLSVAPDAPLFQSTLEEEDDEQERDREAADLYALQRSRRLAAAQLAESTESEGLEGRSRASMEESLEADDPYSNRALGRGIKSSWPGTRALQKSRGGSGAQMEDRKLSRARMGSTQTQHMVDIGLESQLFHDDDPPESLLGDADYDPNSPNFQRLKKKIERTPYMKRTVTNDTDRAGYPPLAPIAEDAPAQKQEVVASPEGEAFHHDPFFAWLFLITFAGMMSTFVLVLLNTSSSKSPVGDTIYTTIQNSVQMLVVDTLVSILVSLVWLAAMKSFVRPLVNLIIVAVPVVMMSFSIYTLVSSFQGQTHGASLQDKVMRWFSLAPAFGCMGWIWLVVRGRKYIQQAVEILQFSSKILAENSALLLVGFGCLAVVVAWTWIWLAMFTRVFMGGHFSKNRVRFIIEFSSWWLGAAFILLYLWTLSVINAVHSATTAATVSQWYFHRNAGPATPSKQIVAAAAHHAMTTIFGSICESTLISLLIRAPSIFLPRMGNMISNAAGCCMPAPIMSLTNPLTVTYAAIHSHNLHASARGLEQLEIIAATHPSAHPRTVHSRGTSAIRIPYQLAKALLISTRLLMATGMGFAAWVITAKQLHIDVADGVGLKGSAYAYVIGIVASLIGFSITGAIESILSDIVDAVLICYGSERRMETGHGRYCLEAAYLFGERRVSMVDSDYA